MMTVSAERLNEMIEFRMGKATADEEILAIALELRAIRPILGYLREQARLEEQFRNVREGYAYRDLAFIPGSPLRRFLKVAIQQIAEIDERIRGVRSMTRTALDQAGDEPVDDLCVICRSYGEETPATTTLANAPVCERCRHQGLALARGR